MHSLLFILAIVWIEVFFWFEFYTKIVASKESSRFIYSLEDLGQIFFAVVPKMEMLSQKFPLFWYIAFYSSEKRLDAKKPKPAWGIEI